MLCKRVAPPTAPDVLRHAGLERLLPGCGAPDVASNRAQEREFRDRDLPDLEPRLPATHELARRIQADPQAVRDVSEVGLEAPGSATGAAYCGPSRLIARLGASGTLSRTARNFSRLPRLVLSSRSSAAGRFLAIRDTLSFHRSSGGEPWPIGKLSGRGVMGVQFLPPFVSPPSATGVDIGALDEPGCCKTESLGEAQACSPGWTRRRCGNPGSAAPKNPEPRQGRRRGQGRQPYGGAAAYLGRNPFDVASIPRPLTALCLVEP
jgi:hypothetical protein